MANHRTVLPRAAGTSLVLAVCLAGGIGVGTSAQAATSTGGFGLVRTSGNDRTETAVAVSQQVFPTAGAASAVVIVNGGRDVDGLTASYVAGLKNAPILYTDTNSVPAATAKELHRLTTRDLYVVGGDTVVSPDLVKTWQEAGYAVTRLAGSDRYATAAAVAAVGHPAAGSLTAQASSGKVFLASGESGLADALSVSPIAYAEHYPILLTAQGSIPDVTKRALTAQGGAGVVVVGGTAVVSDAVQQQLGAQRLAGADRQDTAVKVADFGIAQGVYCTTDVGLVAGSSAHLSDALVAAVMAGKGGYPLLYTGSDGSSSATTTAYLTAHAADLTGATHVVGGTSAVSDAAGKAAVTTVTTAAPPPRSSTGGRGSSDITAPVFVSAAPADSALVTPAAALTATFNEPVTSDSVVTVTDTTASSPVTGVVSATGPTVTFHPTSALTDGHQYTAVFAGRDPSGNISADATIHVTADGTAPTIASASGTSSTQVTLTTSEDVTVQGGTLTPGDFTYASDGSTFSATATGAMFSSPRTIVLTFAGGVLPATGVRSSDAIRFTDSDGTLDNGDVVDGAGNTAATSGAVTVADGISPAITGVAVSSAGMTPEWDEVGEVLTLTYGEPVVVNGISAGPITQAQVRTLTGLPSITFAVGSTITLSTSGSTVTLTIGGVDLTMGAATSTDIPGSATGLVQDAAGNDAVASTTHPQL